MKTLSVKLVLRMSIGIKNHDCIYFIRHELLGPGDYGTYILAAWNRGRRGDHESLNFILQIEVFSKSCDF